MSSLGVGKFCTLVNLFRCLVPRSFAQTWALEPQWKQVVCPVFGSPWSTVVGGKGFGVWMPLIYVSKWDTNIWLLFTGSRRSETSKISHNLQSGHIWGETRHFGPLCKLWLILEVSDLWDPVNKSQTLYIEAKLGGTVISQVVGYYMGEKMIPRVGGGSISPPAGDIGPPFSSTWVQNGAQTTLGKGVYSQLVGWWTVGHSRGVGLWFTYGFHFRSRGLSHLQSEIFSPLVLDHWFRTEFERKAYLTYFWVCEMYGIPWEVGFGFNMGLTPLLYESKWDTNIWLLLIPYRRSGNPFGGGVANN